MCNILSSVSNFRSERLEQRIKNATDWPPHPIATPNQLPLPVGEGWGEGTECATYYLLCLTSDLRGWNQKIKMSQIDPRTQ
jgi:hypothetical protein